jgi:hypothetical protein
MTYAGTNRNDSADIWDILLVKPSGLRLGYPISANQGVIIFVSSMFFVPIIIIILNYYLLLFIIFS